MLIFVFAALRLAVLTNLSTPRQPLFHVRKIACELVGESLADRQHPVDLSDAIRECDIGLLKRD